MDPSRSRTPQARRARLRRALIALAALALVLLLAPATLAQAASSGKPHQRCASASRIRARSVRRCRRRRAREKRVHTRARRRRPVRTSVAQESAAESVSASVAAVLATPCVDTELTPEPANAALVRAAMLCLINRKRAENGERPLIADAELEAAAESHTSELVADDYFAHVSPSGETPVERIRDTGYLPSPGDGYVLGENLAWGTYELSTPLSIADAWFASPPHLANILEAQYQQTGIAVEFAVPASLADGAPGATWAQEFGVVLQ